MVRIAPKPAARWNHRPILKRKEVTMSIAAFTQTYSPAPEGAPQDVVDWVDEIAALTLPAEIV